MMDRISHDWESLQDKSCEELDEIKHGLQEELYEIRKDKTLRIQNILAIQGLIMTESK